LEAKRAKENMAAANALVAEASVAADEVTRERRSLQSKESLAERERHAAADARAKYEEELRKAKDAELLAKAQRRDALTEKLALENKERLTIEQMQKEKEETEKQRVHHYEAAAAMKEQTAEARAAAELASRERTAAEREKAQAILATRQAGADKMTAITISFISWILLGAAILAVLSLSVEISTCGPMTKWDGAGLSPAQLLRSLMLNIRRIPAMAASDRATPKMPSQQDEVVSIISSQPAGPAESVSDAAIGASPMIDKVGSPPKSSQVTGSDAPDVAHPTSYTDALD
jgi:hypothetical protein